MQNEMCLCSKKGIAQKRYSFAAKLPKMYSSENLEKFYFDYRTEWMPRGMSIQAYCSLNNVLYKVLDRWIRDIYKRVVPVQVTGSPDELKLDNPHAWETLTEKQEIKDNGVSIKIVISTSSRMELSRDGVEYRSLRSFIEKLDGLLC